MSKNVKTNPVLLEHSEAKVKLLSEYLNRYLNIISNDKYTQKINVYDLFCGEGLYENGGQGSPLIILKAIKDLHFINKAKNNLIPPVNIVFNDKQIWKTEKLKNVVSDKKLYYPEYGTIQFKNEDYKNLLSSLLANGFASHNEKAFVFIDPYGYSHIRASDIKKVMESKKAEVLLFLPTQFMYRFDESGTPESLIDILDEIANYKEWKTLSAHDFVSKFTEGLRTYMGNDYFVDTFLIEKDKNTLFCLFFFTSHIKGFEKMLEAKWEIDEEMGVGFRYMSNTMNQYDLFGVNSAGHPLESKLLNFLKAGKKYNGDVYNFVLHNGYLPKHANEVLASLQERAILQVKSITGEKVRKKAFYISYTYYKSDPSKVYYQI